MLASYHTHTSRCAHASGTDEEYIKKAIAEGVKILGFADHAPYIYPDGYVSYYKMKPSEAREYIASISALREKYRDKIEILIGLEAEYYPALWKSTLEFWRELGSIEYLLLGQHYTCEEYPRDKARHSFDGFSERDPVTEYVDTVIAAIKTERFTCIAHPDVLNYTGPELDFYRSEMHRLMRAVTEYDIPLELNLLGLASKRNYPNPQFWSIASEYSPKVILGCDSHSPRQVADKEEVINGLRFADKYKLNVIETLDLVSPFN